MKLMQFSILLNAVCEAFKYKGLKLGHQLLRQGLQLF